MNAIKANLLIIVLLLTGFVAACPPNKNQNGQEPPIEGDMLRITKYEKTGDFVVIHLLGESFMDYRLVYAYCDKLLSLDGEPFFSPNKKFFAAVEMGSGDSAHIEIYKIPERGCPQKVYDYPSNAQYYFSDFQWKNNDEFVIQVNDAPAKYLLTFTYLKNQWQVEKGE